MKNQKYPPNKDKSVSKNSRAELSSQDENKEPSMLDKLNEQIKKLKEIKEKGAGTDPGDE
jgi:hypothetical protein